MTFAIEPWKHRPLALSDAEQVAVLLPFHRTGCGCCVAQHGRIIARIIARSFAGELLHIAF